MLCVLIVIIIIIIGQKEIWGVNGYVYSKDCVLGFMEV